MLHSRLSLCHAQSAGLKSDGGAIACFQRLVHHGILEETGGLSQPSSIVRDSTAHQQSGLAAEFDDGDLLPDATLRELVLRWATMEPTLPPAPPSLSTSEHFSWVDALRHRAAMLTEGHWTQVAMVRAAIRICCSVAAEQPGPGRVENGDDRLHDSLEGKVLANMPFNFSMYRCLPHYSSRYCSSIVHTILCCLRFI
jgi:hypothetical protein